MEGVDYWVDSQDDSVEYDASMFPDAQDDSVEYDVSMFPDAQGDSVEAICRDEEVEDHVIGEDGRDIARNELVEEECMIAEDTFQSDDLVSIGEEEVQSTAGYGSKVEEIVKDEAIMVDDDAAIMVDDDAEIVVIDDDIVLIKEDIVVIDNEIAVIDEEIVLIEEDIVVIDDEIVVIDDFDQPSTEEDLQGTEGKRDRDFDLNKLPLSEYQNQHTKYRKLLEQCCDWSNASTRRVVMQVDPELSRTVIVSTKLDTKIPQFAQASDVGVFLSPPAHTLDGFILGDSPFFTFVPSGRVGCARDSVYQSNDEFKQVCPFQLMLNIFNPLSTMLSLSSSLFIWRIRQLTLDENEEEICCLLNDVNYMGLLYQM